MATWVVYHNISRSSNPEYAVKEVPEGVGGKEVISVLDASQKGCLMVPKTDLMKYLHEVCLLEDAPKNVQDAYKAGKFMETIKWAELWAPIT